MLKWCLGFASTSHRTSGRGRGWIPQWMRQDCLGTDGLGDRRVSVLLCCPSLCVFKIPLNQKIKRQRDTKSKKKESNCPYTYFLKLYNGRHAHWEESFSNPGVQVVKSISYCFLVHTHASPHSLEASGTHPSNCFSVNVQISIWLYKVNTFLCVLKAKQNKVAMNE